MLIWKLSRHAGAVAAAAVMLLGLANPASALEASLETGGIMSARFDSNLCENNPGPFITMNGEFALEGLNGRLIFRNNVKGTHEASEDVSVDFSILEDGQTIGFAKQPPDGGVGGNPYIFIQLHDGKKVPYTDEIFLGRCVQGLDPVAEELILASVAQMTVTTGDCSGAGGPSIKLSGELRLGGVDATLTFTNSDQFPPHIRDEDAEVSFVVLKPGESISFAKAPPQGGAGGNPLIYFQFTDTAGEAMTEEFFLGRCNQLSS